MPLFIDDPSVLLSDLTSLLPFLETGADRRMNAAARLLLLMAGVSLFTSRRWFLGCLFALTIVSLMATSQSVLRAVGEFFEAGGDTPPETASDTLLLSDGEAVQIERDESRFPPQQNVLPMDMTTQQQQLENSRRVMRNNAISVLNEMATKPV